jgi:hypothetical protein
MAVMQLAAISQFGCGVGVASGNDRSFSKNTLKRTPKGNHYG